MAKFILGKKVHMTQIFAEDGRVVPVTVVEAGPCTVVKTKGKKKAILPFRLVMVTRKK